jgi:hypothetical protein
LRSRAFGVLIFCQHILGDIISPPIIGGVSDSTGSLKLALQMTWIAIGVAGLWWFAAFYFLPPLPIDTHMSEDAMDVEDSAGELDSVNTVDTQVVLVGTATHVTPTHTPAIYDEELNTRRNVRSAELTTDRGNEVVTNVLLNNSISNGALVVRDGDADKFSARVTKRRNDRVTRTVTMSDILWGKEPLQKDKNGRIVRA